MGFILEDESMYRLAAIVLVITAISSLLIGSGPSAQNTPSPRPGPNLAKADYDDVLINPNDDARFQRFLDKLPQLTLDGRTDYLIEGDLRLTRQEVRRNLLKYLQNQKQTQDLARAPRVGSSSDELYVMTDANDRPVKWSLQERALTYAVHRNSFGHPEAPPGLYDEVVQNMQEAAKAWVEPCDCGLSIMHRAEHDADPSLDNVTFIVRFVPGSSGLIALSFFPNDSKDKRYLSVWKIYRTSQFDRVGVFRHELGHVMAYRHAHINGVPGCAPDADNSHWVALSEYDAKSAMHYPCGGNTSNKFELSDRDKSDHKAYYSAQ
jgi:hypothetical protein